MAKPTPTTIKLLNGGEFYHRVTPIKVTASATTIRTAQYDGHEHIVVPAVIMVANAVIRPLHSKGPEFVPAEELVKSLPDTMNGRPIVYDHPKDGKGSANDPATLDKEQFGQVFNCRIHPDTGNLIGDLYFSPSRAAKVGDYAVKVIEACKAGETVELSCGTYLNLEQRKGTSPSGVAYEYVWHNMSYDHLAVGLSGGRGACSTDVGCGTNRMAQQDEQGLTITTLEGLGDETIMNLKDIPRKWLQSMSSLLKLSQDISDKSLRDNLDQLLYNTTPAFGYISEVRPTSSTVYYCTYPTDDSGPLYWKQSFKVNEDETVELVGTAEKVIPKMTWEAAATTNNTSNNDDDSGTCKCHNNNDGQEVNDMNKDQKLALAKELIAAGVQLDEATLVALDDKVLQAMKVTATSSKGTTENATAAVEDKGKTETTTKTDKTQVAATAASNTATPVAPVAPATPKNEAEWLALAPKEVQDNYGQMKAASAAYQREQEGKRTTLIAQIKACTTVYPDDKLTKMSLEDLDLLHKAVSVDYSGLGAGGNRETVQAGANWDPWGLHAAKTTTTTTTTAN